MKFVVYICSTRIMIFLLKYRILKAIHCWTLITWRISCRHRPQRCTFICKSTYPKPSSYIFHMTNSISTIYFLLIHKIPHKWFSTHKRVQVSMCWRLMLLSLSASSSLPSSHHHRHKDHHRFEANALFASIQCLLSWTFYYYLLLLLCHSFTVSVSRK